MGEALGLAVWNEDEAGPCQTKPYPGRSWQPEGEPAQQPHGYMRDGTAKLLSLFHPADGQLRVKGVPSSANAVLHPWLEEELGAILTELPPPALTPEEQRLLWRQWQADLSHPIWNRKPTPFEWGGKRAARRQRKHALAASGAVAYRPTRHRSTVIQKWLRANQTTH